MSLDQPGLFGFSFSWAFWTQTEKISFTHLCAKFEVSWSWAVKESLSYPGDPVYFPFCAWRLLREVSYSTRYGWFYFQRVLSGTTSVVSHNRSIWVISLTASSVCRCLSSHLGCFFPRKFAWAPGISLSFGIKKKTSLLLLQLLQLLSECWNKNGVHLSWCEPRGFKRCFKFCAGGMADSPLPCGVCMRRESTVRGASRSVGSCLLFSKSTIFFYNLCLVFLVSFVSCWHKSNGVGICVPKPADRSGASIILRCGKDGICGCN